MNVVIIGAGGHGRVVLDILRYDPDAKVVGFIDDNLSLRGTNVDGIPVLGNMESLPELRKTHAVDGAAIAIGDNKIRARIFYEIIKMGMTPKSAIHPRAVIAKDVKIGSGVAIAAGAVVAEECVIGDNVIINTRVLSDYGVKIGNHSHVSPGVVLAGQVKIGEYAHIGLGVTVEDGLVVGDGTIVGAGAVVMENVPAQSIAVGVPSKVIKQNGKTKSGETE